MLLTFSHGGRLVDRLASVSKLSDLRSWRLGPFLIFDLYIISILVDISSKMFV